MVEILVNDTRLPEYDDNVNKPDLPKTLTKYFEATPGAESATRVSSRKYYVSVIDLSDRVFVDSYLKSPLYVVRHGLFNYESLISETRAKLRENCVTRKLRFAQLSVRWFIV
jgi:hypothetical protein